ncbi:hypothetical protein AVME950_04355 [Acidovorax sp. SUPP950]|uniref:hypothetical protein n=1 Tax=Acidovorax sp. SUPP950 TaxID=511901 RepID=UPI0023C6C637|nr:hypothetical protein [Acidovorax sp. SUPP950]GKS74089.1 hypothetical protein AVME950_04355 [Acidovorax sp. SUPP950]
MIEHEAMAKITNYSRLTNWQHISLLKVEHLFLQLTIDARNTDRLHQRRALSSSKHPQRERF